MFFGRTNHVCTLTDGFSKSYLPKLSPASDRKKKIRRFFRRWILVAESNPNSIYFYRDAAAIIDQRKIQAASKSWIIHPFSMFRLYYEMWMTLLFLISLIYMPLYSSFYQDYDNLLRLKELHNTLCVLCYVDIIISFRTGRCVSNEVILMKPGEIARNYIFGPYFICDVLSSIPDLESLKDIQLLTFCDMLKVVRFVTFWQYLRRSLNFFRVEGYMIMVTKLCIAFLLLLHYTTCFNYFLDIIDTSWNNPRKDPESLKDFVTMYLNYTQMSASYLLEVESVLPASAMSETKVMFQILFHIIGRIFTIIFTVLLVNLLTIKNRLEISYQGMINQVREYMSNKHMPIPLQDRIIKTYFYQHRGKIINEVRIKRYISDKLKKEIKYHDCRKLIHSVKMFEGLPREVVEDILPYLKREVFLGGDTIVRAGTSGDCMYFLESGTVAVLSPSGKEICHLSDGEYFGEYCLMGPKLRRSATVIALEICELYKVERKLFKKCLQTYPQVYSFLQAEAKKRFKETKEVEKSLFSKTTIPSDSDSLHFLPER